MRRLVVLASALALGVFGVPALAGAGQQDQAAGSGKTAGGDQVLGSARGTPVAAQGQVQLHTALGNKFKGSVDCLNVFPIPGGLRAVAEGTVEQPAPISRFRAVVDDLGNGNGTGQRDRVLLQASSSRQGCQPQSGDVTEPIVQGNFELKDGS